MFSKLYFSLFKFSLSPIERILLPHYKGSALRGGFGTVFKQVACTVRKQYCHQCILKATCAYSYIFETPCTDSLKAKYNLSDYPHPFVIEPPLEQKQEYGPGESLDFNLLLIGKGIDYLPYFVFTFEELGRRGIGRGRGKYHLEKVEALAQLHQQQGTIIYDGRSKTLSAKYEVKDLLKITEKASRDNQQIDRLTLHFLTPTRIKHRGKLTKDVDFEIILRGLLRRILLLSELHCDQKLDINCEQLLRKAEAVRTVHNSLHWQDWQRYSSRQQARMKLGGFLGQIAFQGDLDKFMPFIRLGEYLHLGKGTSFGLGKYRIIT